MNLIGLGRRRPPTRSKDDEFLIRKVPTVATSKTWSSPGVLDQGATSQCVAFSGFKYLTSGPVINRRPKERPRDLYRECLLVDEWPGEDWDGGTSVRALFKVFQRLGYVDEYRWAFDCETVVNHVLTTGPIVMGTVWSERMANLPRTNYIDVDADLRSVDEGHAWLIIGANRKRKNPNRSVGAARMINSWGEGWGQKGRAWITFEDLDRLIKEDGEACVATEVKISALEPFEEEDRVIV